MGAGNRVLQGKTGRNQFEISDDEINAARIRRADIGVEVKIAESLIGEFAVCEWYGKLPEGIVAHHVHRDQWTAVKTNLDARGQAYKWRALVAGAPLNSENGADW